MANNVLKNKDGEILNPKIPRYEKKILWENDNDNSNFSSQSINLNDSNYKYYEILWKVATNSNNYLSTGKIPKDKGCQLVCLSGGSGDPLRVRSVNVTFSSQLNFGNAYKGASETTTIATDICIPCIIYGYYD